MQGEQSPLDPAERAERPRQGVTSRLDSVEFAARGAIGHECQARAEGRIGGRRKKLNAGKRKQVAESAVSGRKSGAEMARLYNISAPTVSRIIARQLAGGA